MSICAPSDHIEGPAIAANASNEGGILSEKCSVLRPMASITSFGWRANKNAAAGVWPGDRRGYRSPHQEPQEHAKRAIATSTRDWYELHLAGTLAVCESRPRCVANRPRGKRASAPPLDAQRTGPARSSQAPQRQRRPLLPRRPLLQQLVSRCTLAGRAGGSPAVLSK